MANPYTVQAPYANYPIYAPQYYQPTQIPAFQNQNSNNMAWVQGESGAKSYPLGPNSKMFLFDSEEDCFYVKTTDQNGIPQKLKKFVYYEKTEEQENQQSDYVTREELEEILSKLRKKENNNGKSFVRNNESQQRNERPIQ